MNIQNITEIVSTATKIDQKIVISHHLETTHSIHIDEMKTIEVLRKNINDKIIRYKLQLKQLETH